MSIINKNEPALHLTKCCKRYSPSFLILPRRSLLLMLWMNVKAWMEVGNDSLQSCLIFKPRPWQIFSLLHGSSLRSRKSLKEEVRDWKFELVMRTYRDI